MLLFVFRTHFIGGPAETPYSPQTSPTPAHAHQSPGTSESSETQGGETLRMGSSSLTLISEGIFLLPWWWRGKILLFLFLESFLCSLFEIKGPRQPPLTRFSYSEETSFKSSKITVHLNNYIFILIITIKAHNEILSLAMSISFHDPIQRLHRQSTWRLLNLRPELNAPMALALMKESASVNV